MNLHSVLRVSPKNFDCQVSLDPFEEHLNLPAVAEDVGDNKRTKFEVVGYKGNNLVLFSIIRRMSSGYLFSLI